MNRLPVIPQHKAVAWLKSRKPSLNGQIYCEGDGTYPAGYNFYVGDLNDLAQIKIVQDTLAKALLDGNSLSEWQSILNSNGIVLFDAEAIYRTNIFAALNEGRYEGFLEDADDFPYLMYDALQDERVRHNHAANDGLVMRIDDPRWDGRVPPLGIGCRCNMVQLSADEARTRGNYTSPQPNSEADSPEWGRAPFRNLALSNLKADELADQTGKDNQTNSQHSENIFEKLVKKIFPRT